MAILDDLGEIRRLFQRSGPFGKVVLILSGLLSVGSLANLADDAFAWKGFILSGLEFYRVVIAERVRDLASAVGLLYTKDEFDAMVILSLSVSIGMRILCMGQIVAFEQINLKYNSTLRPKLAVYWMIGIGFPLFCWVFYGTTDQDPNFWLIGAMTVIYPLFLTLPKELLRKFRDSDSYFEKGKFNYHVAYYAYIGAILLIIAILAAVNTGLQRTA